MSPSISAGTKRGRPDPAAFLGLDLGLLRLGESEECQDRPEALGASPAFETLRIDLTDGDLDRAAEPSISDTASEAARDIDLSSCR